MAANSRTALFPAGCVLVGLILLAISIAWPRMFPAKLYWDDEKEERLEQINQFVHDRIHRVRQAEQAGNTLDPQFVAEYERATSQGDRLRREADVARVRPAQIARRWRWAGIAALAVGIGVWFWREKISPDS